MSTSEENIDTPDAPLEAMLGEHFSKRLGGQIGRAAVAFGREMDAKMHAEELRRTRRAWIWASIPTAIAACIAIVATIGYMGARNDPGVAISGQGGTNPGAAPVAQRIDENTYYRDFDAGIRVVRDETGSRPMRAIRRQVIRETQWYDPVEKATMRVTVPEEGTVYVKVQPF